MNKLRLSLMLAAATLFGAAAPAGVFANELTNQVLDLQKNLQAQDGRLGRLESQLQNKGLLNLLNQLEALKAEVARLRGAQEELVNQQSVGEKRAKDLFADLDDRIKELETRPVASAALQQQPDAVRLQAAQVLSKQVAEPAVPARPSGNAQKDYEAAYSLVKAGRYQDAVVAMQTFVKNYPGDSLIPNAHYWTGFSYVGMGDFANAGSTYEQLIQRFPNNPKTPDAMLSLSRAKIQANEPADAVTILEQLVARFPFSRAATEAKKLLSSLK
jgi:tol-pal system protein YbgF